MKEKKVLTEEHKAKISKAKMGHPVSQKTRRKIGLANRGNVPWNKGKKMSAESRRKMSEAKKGVPKSEATRRAMKEAWKRRRRRGKKK